MIIMINRVWVVDVGEK